MGMITGLLPVSSGEAIGIFPVSERCDIGVELPAASSCTVRAARNFRIPIFSQENPK